MTFIYPLIHKFIQEFMDPLIHSSIYMFVFHFLTPWPISLPFICSLTLVFHHPLIHFVTFLLTCELTHSLTHHAFIHLSLTQSLMDLSFDPFTHSCTPSHFYYFIYSFLCLLKDSFVHVLLHSSILLFTMYSPTHSTDAYCVCSPCKAQGAEQWRTGVWSPALRSYRLVSLSLAQESSLPQLTWH